MLWPTINPRAGFELVLVVADRSTPSPREPLLRWVRSPEPLLLQARLQSSNPSQLLHLQRCEASRIVKGAAPIHSILKFSPRQGSGPRYPRGRPSGRLWPWSDLSLRSNTLLGRRVVGNGFVHDPAEGDLRHNKDRDRPVRPDRGKAVASRRQGGGGGVIGGRGGDVCAMGHAPPF